MPAPTFDRSPLRRQWAVLVAVVSVGLSGCARVDSGDSTEPPASVFESAPCPSPNFPGHPELDLGNEFSCGFLSVPENRANPGGRKIKLAVARAKAPLTVEVPPTDGQPPRRVVIDGYRLANLVVQASLTADSYADLPQTIHAIANGDGIAAARTVLAASPPPGVIGYGLAYGVFCREDAASTDPVAALALARHELPDLPVEVLSLAPQAPRLFDECGIWDVGRADATVHEPARSDVPVLLLAGTLDAVTPPSQADEAAATLPHSKVVRFPGLGHDVVSASECGRQIMADFLNRPDRYETRCADEMRPPTFSG